MYTSIERQEMHYAKRYLDYEETEGYRAFRDKDNPDCHEANYAVLKSCDNAAQSIAAVEAFFAWRGASQETPVLFRSAPDAVPVMQANRALSTRGYALKPCHPTLLVRGGKAAQVAQAQVIDCATKYIDTVTLWPERALAKEALGGKAPLLRLLDTRMQAGGKAFFAYNKADVPVSVCFGEGYGSAFCVSHLYTPVPCRKQGCATAVLAAALRYAHETGYTDLYATTYDKATTHVYNRLGFRGQQAECYWASKGALPTWVTALP